MANYNLTQTGDEVQAYIDSIPVIDVTGTLSGSNIVFATNPYSQIAANYAADCGSVVRLTVGTAVYLLRVTQYDGTNYTAAEMSGAHNVVATIGSSSASATIDAGIDTTPTQGSDNLVKSGGVYGYINGNEVTVEVAQELTANEYYNMTGPITNGDTSYSRGTSSSSGTYCAKIAVQAGEKYKIVSYNNSAAAGRYVLVKSDNSVVSYLGNASRSHPTQLTIANDGYLYVNFKSYNSSTDGLFKIVTEITGGLIIDDLTTGGSDKALSAEQGKVLKGLIDYIGTGTEDVTAGASVTLDANVYYNTTGATAIGDYWTKNSAASSTIYSARFRVNAGERYTIHGEGNTDANKLYVLVDINNYVVALYKGNARTTPQIVTIKDEWDGGILYINLLDYSAQTDSVVREIVTLEGGDANAKKYANSVRPMYGKKVFLFGDSQLGQSIFARDINYRIKHLVGGEVYNFGFGGCRMSWRTADGSNGYDKFSMVDLSDAMVSGDFSAQLAQTTILADKDYYAETIAKMQEIQPTIGSGKDCIFTIAYGSNDFYGNAALTDNGKNTFIGALNYAVQTLLTAFPRSTIIVISPSYRVYDYTSETPEGITSDSDNYTNAGGLKVVDYVNAEKVACDALHILFFDVFRNNGRNKYTIFTFTADGVHPTLQAGKDNRAEMYGKVLTSWI